jgi:hypothetical protein
MDVHVDFSDLHTLTEKLEVLPDAIADQLERAAQDIAVRIRGDAAKNAPSDTGQLRSSLEGQWEQFGEFIRVRVGSNLDQAAPQEFGTDPGHFPPPSELRDWARRVLGDESAAFAVARSIAETGRELQRNLRDAQENNIEWAVKRLTQAVRDAYGDVGLN